MEKQLKQNPYENFEVNVFVEILSTAIFQKLCFSKSDGCIYVLRKLFDEVNHFMMALKLTAERYTSSKKSKSCYSLNSKISKYSQDLNSENPDIIPLTYPFLYFDPTIELRPNQEVTLTLLMNPLAAVHASSGVLPQKEIKMTRNHFDSALSKIAPTFKIGPVLVDPGSIRMPLPNQGNIAWSWGFKENYSSWLDEDVEDADQSAKLRKGRLKAWEGWLKLDPIEESD